MNQNSRRRMGTITNSVSAVNTKTDEERINMAKAVLKMDRYNYIKKRRRVDGYSS